MRVLTIERASADTADGATVGATVLRISLPDPEAADLANGGDSTTVGEAIATAITTAVADGSLVLP